MILAALLSSTKEFLGLVYLIVMIGVIVFGFVPQGSPYSRYAFWPVVICLAILGWILFGPGT